MTADFVIALKTTRLTGVSFLMDLRLVRASCRCEYQRVIFLERIGNGFNVLAAVVCDFPLHLETGVGVDRSVLGGQVPHMAVRGQYSVIVTQIGVDCLCFCWGLYNDNRHIYGTL